MLGALIDHAEGMLLELRMDLCVHQTRGGHRERGWQRCRGLERKERYAIEESGLVSTTARNRIFIKCKF